MRFREKILFRYLCHAPFPLAIERAIESHLYQHCSIERPVLDIGCGDGLFARMVFASPLDTGVDADASEIERAHRHPSYRELIHTPGDRIPKPDESYKTIISNSVLEHIPDLAPVLAEIHRLLDLNGRFYLTAPSEHFATYSVIARCLTGMGLYTTASSYCRFYNRFWKHYHCYSLDGWAALVRKAGFEVVEGFTYNPPQTCMVNDALAPFALPGVFIKKWTGNWVFSPATRALMLGALYPMLRKLVDRSGRCRNGGLVFMALRKA